MKNIIKYLVLGLTLATNQLYPAAAAEDVAAQEEEQKDTRAAIALSLKTPEEIRAQAKRERELAEFRKKEEIRLKAEREKKRGRQAQEAAAQPIAGLGQPDEELDAAIAASLQEQPSASAQEETKEEEEKELKIYKPYKRRKIREIVGRLPNVLGEQIEAMAQPTRVFETNSAGLINSVIIEGNDEDSPKISPDSTLIVTKANKYIYVRNSTTGKILYNPIPYDNSAEIFISKNNLIAIVSDNTAEIWDGNTRTFKYRLGGHTGMITTLAFSSDNQFIVTGSTDYTARIWNATDGALRHTLSGHTEYINSVVISQNNMFIVTQSNDGTAHIWDPITGTILSNADTGFYLPTLENGPAIGDVAISSDNKFIATGSEDSVHIWNAHTGELLHRTNGLVGPNLITSIAISKNNQFILATSIFDETACVLNAHDGKLIYRLRDIDSSATISSNNQLIAATSSKNTAHVWDANTGQLLHTFTDPNRRIRSIDISPNMQFIVTSSSAMTTHANSIIRIWRAKPVPAIAAHARTIESFIPQANQLLNQAKQIKHFPAERLEAIQGYIHQLETAPSMHYEQNINAVSRVIKTEFELGKEEAEQEAAQQTRRDKLIAETQRLITQAQNMRYFPKDLIQKLQDQIELLNNIKQNDHNIKASISTINNTIITTFNAGKAEHIRVPIIKETITQAVHFLNQAKRIKLFPAGHLRAIQEHINALETTPSMTTAHAQDILRLIKKEFELGKQDAKEKEDRQDR
ncbi:MAG TPA: hypothetical protein VGT41_05080 [Candidatus Babeliales bacterium]|nr:hypothetical protein [Candidatus Babeliales bacterium]